jgi:hypothetical protein
MSEIFSFGAEEVRSGFVSGERLAALCDHVWSADRRNPMVRSQQLASGSTVFAQVDDIPTVLERAKLRPSKFVLVTAEGDKPASAELARWRPPQVSAWFSTNATAEHVECLPLGLGGSYCQVTTKAPDLAAAQTPNESRPHWLYVNFRPNTNPPVRGPLLEKLQALAPQDWLTLHDPSETLSPSEYLQRMTSHRFVLCPPGNGLDTHRMWEALYTKTIPIVLHNAASKHFSDLPLVAIRDAEELNLSFLEEEYARIQARVWDFRRMFMPWWEDRIAHARLAIQGPASQLGNREFLRFSLTESFAMIRRRLGF